MIFSYDDEWGFFSEDEDLASLEASSQWGNSFGDNSSEPIWTKGSLYSHVFGDNPSVPIWKRGSLFCWDRSKQRVVIPKNILFLSDELRMHLAKIRIGKKTGFLYFLMHDPSRDIREELAFDGNEDHGIPTEALDALSKDKETNVRLAVASNGRTLSKTLKRLASDKKGAVRQAILTNSSVGPEIRAIAKAMFYQPDR